jgi:uncharacterized protein (DUF488 family)
MAATFYTIGHARHAIAQFAALLAPAGVDCVVDVRAFPRSRSNPQFNIETLPPALAPFGIGYRHLPELGGRRGRQAQVPPARNALWQNRGFHNYATTRRARRFAPGLPGCWISARHRCAIMCAEALWWRCHRRIIADYLIARGARVLHILPDGRIAPAQRTPGARRRRDGTLAYPAAAA